jgi:sugar phosphate permease
MAAFLFVLYVANFVDRANLAYAGLEVSHDLGFGERVFGAVAGVFFVGYLSLQISGALMAERWGARHFIGSIIIALGWTDGPHGIGAGAVAFYMRPGSFLAPLRPPFFPAVLIYLSHWFVYEDVPRQSPTSWRRSQSLSSSVLRSPGCFSEFTGSVSQVGAGYSSWKAYRLCSSG